MKSGSKTCKHMREKGFPFVSFRVVQKVVICFISCFLSSSLSSKSRRAETNYVLVHAAWSGTQTRKLGLPSIGHSQTPAKGRNDCL